ncbi:SNF2 family N-terminal domain protein [Aeromicrobium marinum DSM 15272]|uniref:SNF2 family N-terminal domain protein n=1 Tax=Aeromicrobium marinum DSM 15272 TaxID=585531 RepID=E2SAH0_9ACTN|nr:DEAD/DEAH box helicase [Aeromicrobium marinum]EFQ84244.1 SNF2 family N-terminal domain protein [Aeromicrobium marinum DSM 15272]
MTDSDPQLSLWDGIVHRRVPARVEGTPVRLAVDDGPSGPQVRVLVGPDEVPAADAYADRDHPLATTRRDVLERIQALARWWPAADRVARHLDDPAVGITRDEHLALADGLVVTQLALRSVSVDHITDVVRELDLAAVLHGGDDAAGFGPGATFTVRWRATLEGEPLTPADLDRIRAAGGGVVEVLGRPVQIDPAELAAHCVGEGAEVTAVEALRALATRRVRVAGRTVPVELDDWLDRVRDRLTGATDLAPVPVPAGLQATLRPYQAEGFRWLELVTSLGLGGCLADDMGLGKTVQLIALHLHRSAAVTTRPTLVVCPASVLGNWSRELARFAPTVEVRTFHGPGRTLAEIPAGAVVLTTFGTLRADVQTLAGTPWGMVVADEAQHVKNSRAATSTAVRSLPSLVRVALTGTPVENDLEELWSILDWTTPGLLGTRAAFRRQFAQPVEAGSQIAADELATLVRPLVLRRRKTDPGIAPDLPPKTVTDLAVTFGSAQARLYEQTVAAGMQRVRESTSMQRRGQVLALITRCKQVCDHPALVEHRGASAKLDVLDDLVDTIVAEDGRALVFTQYVRMGELLVDHWTEREVSHRFLHGSLPVGQRQRMVDEFQAGDLPVLLLSLRAGGTGLNLTAADHVIHYDRWWNPAVEDQATDRAHRIGQTKPVQVHRLTVGGTVEDGIADLIERKRALADAVINTGETALTELSDEDLEQLLRLRR